MERVVAGYRLERRLGKGAMGEVWLGRHADTGGIAAVKLLRDGLRARMQQLFARERRAIGRLSHPHIVGLYDVGDDYLITAYVHGRDLQHRLRTPLAPSLALRITRQIASALEHAHESGVVHRDIKPSNILLDEDEHAYLADFGVARLLDEEEHDVGAGTPAFMAPEQTRGELATPASDQYALARTLLQLLVGDRLPQDPIEALQLLPTGLPPELRAILWRATDADPAKRYPSVRGFAAALDTIDLSDSPTASPLLPLRRSSEPFGWCAHASRVATSGVDLQRADYRLSELVDGAALDRFRRETGYADFGWAVWARNARLGPITGAEALARVTEVVVLVHGYLGTRDSWDGVAQSICRDNGHTAVLVPDLHGFGESRFDGMPSVEQAQPAGSLRALRAWLSLVGLDDVPTVMVGHSAGGATILSATDAELGPNIHRVAVTPFFPFVDALQRREVVFLSWLVRFAALIPPLYRWMARFFTDTRDLRARYSAAERSRLLGIVLDMDPRILGRVLASSVRAQPARGDQLERCLIIVTPDDPLVPEPIVRRAMKQLGFPAHKVSRLASGGHYPHARSDEHPEWTNRNVDDMVGVIDAVLDQTRSETTGATGETVRSSPRARQLSRTEPMVNARL